MCSRHILKSGFDRVLSAYRGGYGALVAKEVTTTHTKLVSLLLPPVFLLFWKQKMFELREYQKQAVESGVSFFTSVTKNNWSLMVLPTWSWKSLVIANIAMRLPGNTIILQPSKEILEQNFSKIKAYWMQDCAIFSASLWSKQVAKLTFATIGSIISKQDLFSHFHNIIVDECHLVNHEGWQYKEFIEKVWCKVLGLTATPYRLKQYMTWSMLRFLTRTRNSIFQEVIHFTQIQEIAKQWFLAPMKYYVIKAIDSSKLVTNSTGLDYTDRSMRNHFDEIHLKEKIVEIAQRLLVAGRKHILIFTKFVEDAKTISELLTMNGLQSAYVSGETLKKDREKILDDFKSWKIECVANVWVLTTGFDFPELDAIIMARPTKSLALYYQMVGRWMRPHKEKEDCRVVDMSETKDRFGEVSELKLEDQGRWKRVIRSWHRILTNTFMK